MLIQYFGRLIGRALCAMVALFGLAQTQHAIAATVYTYSFEQTNFAYNGGAEAGKVVGTFRGTLDGTGRIELGTLTYFEIHQTGFASPSFMENMFIGVHSAPDFFTFNPSTPATFGFHVALNTIALPLTAEFCMGPAIGLFCAGSGSARGVGTLDGVPALISTSAPTLTLISATPLPGALLLFGTALSGIAGLSLVRRRRSL